MPLGLRQHSFARIDENDCQITSGSTRGHIPRVLLVSRGVGNDEFSLGGRKITVCYIDRDPLLPLIIESVGEESRVESTANGSMGLRVFLQCCQLVLIDHLGLDQHPTDEGAFTVIDTATCQKPQQLFLLVLFQISIDIGGN